MWLSRRSYTGFQIEPAQIDGTVRSPDLNSLLLREPNAMEPEKILHELTYADGLPREALKAASAQRVEMLPLFLDEIETYLALEPAARAKPTPLFFIFHLLGEWRQKAAYRPLARLLRLPRRDVDAIFGDGITTTLEASYDLLLTQRLILQPQIEVNLYSKADPVRMVGAGFSDIDTGLRLRYEIDRKFAPYLGVVYEGKFGQTANFARAAGESTGDVRFVFGVRLWF
jgi:Copper resistance protein B precursor (CopB)/Protein of unknown function (DUF1186)